MSVCTTLRVPEENSGCNICLYSHQSQFF